MHVYVFTHTYPYAVSAWGLPVKTEWLEQWYTALNTSPNPFRAACYCGFLIAVALCLIVPILSLVLVQICMNK